MYGKKDKQLSEIVRKFMRNWVDKCNDVELVYDTIDRELHNLMKEYNYEVN